MPLRRDQVVRAALDLLDEVGLDAFTTRALTDRLGVQRGALYWHVASKRELLTAVAQMITQPVFDDLTAAAEGDWANRYTVFAHRLREVMLAHRDGARLIAGHIQPQPDGRRRMEANLALLAGQGIPLELVLRFADTIASYVTGYVLQEQATPEGVEITADESTPLLAKVLASGGQSSAEVFAASVRTIILGMRAEVAAAVPAK